VSALIIDTSSWIAYLGDGQHAEVIEEALTEGRVYLPPVVAAELTSGNLGKREMNELVFFLQDLALCHTPLEHWLRVGNLRVKLRGMGETISTPDAHVAQCALDLGGELLSEDHVFERIAEPASLRLAAR